MNGQGGLACCDSWGRKESDTTEATYTLGLGQGEVGIPIGKEEVVCNFNNGSSPVAHRTL